MKRTDSVEPTVRALEKGLNILEYLSRVREEIDLSTLAKQTRIPKSTLLRLVNTLKKFNFVQQDPKTQKYQIGWAFIYLGKIASDFFTLPNVVRPYLEELAQRTGETASLVVLEGDHAVYVDQVVSQNIIKGIPPIGSRLGLHCTASGKILLSALSDEELHRFLRGRVLEKKTEKTITKKWDLKREVKKIAVQGYAFDDEETEIGGRCVAAPILDREGKTVAALSIVGPTSRIRETDLERLAKIVKEIAGRASSALGYSSKG